MVFGLLCDIIRENKIDLARVLQAGFSELRLHYVPAVQTYDRSRNAVLNWGIKSNFWNIIDGIDHAKSPQSAQLLTGLVKGELDRRKLIWVSKLKQSPSTFPWISICNLKLEREKLAEDALIRVLVFISCIALISQGWYVDYEHLEVLLGELTLTQNRLKELEILSKFEFKNFNKFKLYKLHWTIPHKLPTPAEESRTSTTEVEKVADESIRELIDHDSGNRIAQDEDTENQTVLSRPVSCLPLVQHKVKWSSRELELLNEIVLIRNGRSAPAMYTIFKERCLSNGIPFRTFRAFENRLKRV